MSRDNSKLQVQIVYNGVEQKFEGSAEETWLLLSKFFSEFIPFFEIARNLWLSIDIQRLSKDCEGVIAYSPEGSNIVVPKNKLTDNEILSLLLLGSYLGCKLNLMQSDAVTKEELQTKLGKTGKITSTRLGELVKMEWAIKTPDDRFRLTNYGVAQMQKDVLPRIIAKTGI